MQLLLDFMGIVYAKQWLYCYVTASPILFRKMFPNFKTRNLSIWHRCQFVDHRLVADVSRGIQCHLLKW